MNFLDKNPGYKINWKNVFKAYEESNGIPILIGKKSYSKKNIAKAN